MLLFIIFPYWSFGMLGACVTGIFLHERHQRFPQLSNLDLTNTAALALCGAVIGARPLYIAITIIYLIFNGIYPDFKMLIQIFNNGFIYYGGLLGAIFIINFYLRRYKLDKQYFWKYATPAIPLFHSFGRLGCYFHGCCYGLASSFGKVMIDGEPHFPIQLICALGEFCLFLLMLYLEDKHERPLPLYLTLYALGRFIIEFFRGDLHRGIFLYLSTSQWISIFLLIYLLLKYWHRDKIKSV